MARSALRGVRLAIDTGAPGLLEEIMAEKVYLVKGGTGEYEDHREWVAGAFKTRDGADRCVQAFINWMALNTSEFSSYNGSQLRKLSDAFVKQFGMHIDIDYNGVVWSIEWRELQE
jgi:hypothetical protein